MTGALYVGALLALGANALFVPPNVKTDAAPYSAGPEAYTQLVRVPCPNCQFARMTDNGPKLEGAGPQDLLVNISVSSDHQSLILNSVPFFPPPSDTTFLTLPSIPHVSADVSLSDIKSRPDELISPPIPLTAWVITSLPVTTDSEPGYDLIDVEVLLTALANTPVTVPRLQIRTLRDAKTNLLLAKVDLADPASPHECHSYAFLCRWRDALMDKFQGARTTWHKMCKGWRGFRNGSSHPPKTTPPGTTDDTKDMSHRPSRRPCGHKKPSAQHHDHKAHHQHPLDRVHSQHGIARLLHWLLFVFIIAFIGIAVGSLFYVLFTSVGYFLAAWLPQYAPNRFIRGYQPIALGEETVVFASKDEEAGLEQSNMDVKEAGEAPPKYVDAVEKE